MPVSDYINKLRLLSKNTKYFKWYESIINSSAIRERPLGYLEYHHVLPKSMGGPNGNGNIVHLTAREHFLCHILLAKMVVSVINRKKMFYALLMLSKCSNQHQQRNINSKMYNRIKSELSTLSSGENNHFYGRVHTAETRKIIGDKSKGRIPGNETREKMSCARLGKKKDPDVVRRQVETRIANGNNRHSDETKKKMSEARMGYKTYKPAWNAGKTKETDAALAKMSESLQGKIPWNKNISEDDPRRQAGERNSFFGKTHSEETIIKIREKAKSRISKKCEYCGKLTSPSNHSRWHNNNCKEYGKNNITDTR